MMAMLSGCCCRLMSGLRGINNAVGGVRAGPIENERYRWVNDVSNEMLGVLKASVVQNGGHVSPLRCCWEKES